MTQSNDRSSWYEEWFDRAEYELVYQKRDDADARLLFDLIDRVTDLQAGARVLDMACGRGRHARLFARRGYKVTGIDLSPAAIETATRLAGEEGLSIRFETGDMRHAPCSKCCLLYTSDAADE